MFTDSVRPLATRILCIALLASVISSGLLLSACGSAATATPEVKVKATPTQTKVATKDDSISGSGSTTGSSHPEERVTPPVATPAKLASLREADWSKVLQSDPNLERESIPSPVGDLWVRFQVAKVEGYPLLQDVQYGDLDGDGQDEAVIPLDSGGTGGIIGFLIYRQAPNGPQIATAKAGQKLQIQVSSGKLAVTEAIFAGWEPNCCPSSLLVSDFRLEQNQLVRVGGERQPLAEAKVITVQQFYQLLNEKRFEEAYQFLSPAFQAKQPYQQWVSGYSTTVSTEANVVDGASGQVTVELTSTDQVSQDVLVKRHFRGSWSLIFSEEHNQWLLDSAQISEVH
jgi:hypothetical protein